MPTDPLYQRIEASLKHLSGAHRVRERRCADAVSTTEYILDGRPCVSFATNDYLGLTRHPKVLRAFASAAAEQYGAGASALIAGRSSLHEQLEKTVADFETTESAVLFPSGFAANYGTLTSLIGSQDAIFCDRDNHASLIDGCRASAGKFFVYDRSKPDHLHELIKRRRQGFEAVFIVTDSVFSMDGTLADLPQLCDIAESHEAAIVVDEAHATGVFGNSGRGVCELQGVENRVAVRVGTFSKAVGGMGGFVAGNRPLCDWLWNSARSQFFSTALPPAVCAAAIASLQVMRAEPERQQRLMAQAVLARQCIAEAGLQTVFDDVSPSFSPIVAIALGDDERAVRVSRRMQDAGYFLPAVRPPTVAAGTARLRMSVCCDHSEEQIRAAVYQLRDVLKTDRS